MGCQKTFNVHHVGYQKRILINVHHMGCQKELLCPLWDVKIPLTSTTWDVKTTYNAHTDGSSTPDETAGCIPSSYHRPWGQQKGRLIVL